MPYLGNQPTSGGYHKLDNLTASATDTYALTLGGSAYYPATANQLMVSLNGVIQAPQDSFTISGSNIVFASALSASDSIDFIMSFGDVYGIGTPADGTITNAKIQSMAASKLTGALPAIDGSALTGVGSNVKEQLVMLCDGEDYTVSSGTYTAANVTVKQDMTTTYADITGSSISYTPPSGTVCVLYEFIFAYVFIDDHAISHFRLYIDSDEVTDQRQTIACQSRPQWQQSLRYIIPIGGTGSTATGRQSTWTTAKTLKIQGRDYGGSNDAELHTADHWDGTSFSGVIKPKLLITALG
jgi:hypothetical protein